MPGERTKEKKQKTDFRIVKEERISYVEEINVWEILKYAGEMDGISLWFWIIQQ